MVIVNDYKRHGWIHYPAKYQALHLWRGDYCASISSYPIALFKNDSGVPHIIYAEDWNHIQIMNLDNLQILTASKSLIEENAEEDQIEFCKQYNEINKHPWPSPYDYFFGKLHMSPDQKRFLSAGWVWGSYDVCNVYDIEHFINSNRIKEISIGAWQHCGRSICWLDNTTVAVPYNPGAEGDKDSNKDSPHEIHFYKVGEETPEIERRIKIPEVDIVNAKIHFNQQLNAIVAFSEKPGIAVISLDGEILFQDKDVKIDSYHPDLNLLLTTEDKTISVYQITS